MLILEKCQLSQPNWHLSLTSYFWKLSCDHIAIIAFQQQFQHFHQYLLHLIFRFTYERINHLHSVTLKIAVIANANFADFDLLLMCLCVYLHVLKMQHYQTSSLVLILAGFLIIFQMNSMDFLHFNLHLPNIIHLLRMNHMTLNFSNYLNIVDFPFACFN